MLSKKNQNLVGGQTGYKWRQFPQMTHSTAQAGDYFAFEDH